MKSLSRKKSCTVALCGGPFDGFIYEPRGGVPKYLHIPGPSGLIYVYVAEYGSDGAMRLQHRNCLLADGGNIG